MMNLILVAALENAEWAKRCHPCPNVYLSSLFRQIKWDTLADFGGQLSEHLRLESADHDLAQPLVQLLQVGRPATVPLSARPKVPARKSESEREAKLWLPMRLLHVSNREKLTKKTYLFTEMP